ncbi:uncharacterized protein [Amphiura filiformis]|uniref:uncharacterized protein n=1 Tax=Amphiura filiformis TaxID=82378 RepID=UPI003B213905
MTRSKQQPKRRKRLFKKWSKSNLEADYNEYREARRNCKKTIKEAKDQSWKTYGEDLAEKSNSSSREFFKAVKAYKQRDEPFDPTAIINDKDGNPLTDSCEITNRWGEYFEDLLNPSGDGDRQQQQPFHPRFQEEVDPPILQEEVRNAIKTSPKNKAAGIDDITTEAIRACGDTGVKWLTRVFNRAWEERAVPDDWQRAIIVPIWKKKGSKRDCKIPQNITNTQPLSREQTTPTTKKLLTVPLTTTAELTTTTLTTLPTTTTPTTQPPTTTMPTTTPTTTTPTTLPTTTLLQQHLRQQCRQQHPLQHHSQQHYQQQRPPRHHSPQLLPQCLLRQRLQQCRPPHHPTTTPPTTTPTTMPTTTPTTTPPTTTPTTMPTTTPTTTPPTTTPTTMPTTTPTTTPPTTTPTTMPTTTPTTTPPTTTPTTMPTTTPTTTPPTTTPTTMPTTTPTTTPPTTTPTTMPTTTPTTTPPTTTPTTMPTTTPTTTPPTTTPTTMPTTTPTTIPPTTTPTTMPTTTPTTTPPTTTIPTTTPTTLPPTTTEPTTTLPPTTTPPPAGVRIVTVDRDAAMSLLPNVDIRILVPGANITRVWEERATGSTGSTLVGLPEEEPVIITFDKYGYLKSSITYKFERVGRNVITMPMSRAPEYREFTWQSGLGNEFKLGNNNRNQFKLEIPPGALDVPEKTRMSLEFKEVDVTNPQELRESPELIGAYTKKKSDGDYEFQGLETFAMAEVSIKELYNPQYFRLFLPLTMEIPLYNLPSDVRPGDRLEAWSYDPHRGVWLYEGKGTVERGRGNERIFIFYARHLSWWAVVRRIDTTNCVTVTTCYDKKCRYPAPNVPVRIRGLDFQYMVQRTTNEDGVACFHYKRHGEIEVSSQCTEKIGVARGKGKSSICPAKYNSELTTTEAARYRTKCTKVKLLVPVSLESSCSVPNIPNGHSIGSDFRPGAEVTFECEYGYYMRGSDRRVCLECGRWSGRKTSCHISYWHQLALSTTLASYATGPTNTSSTMATYSTPSYDKTTLNNEVPQPGQP